MSKPKHFTYKKMSTGNIVITKNKSIHMGLTPEEEKELYALLRCRHLNRGGWGHGCNQFELNDNRK